MLYREAGRFTVSYAQERQFLRHPVDRVAFWTLAVVATAVVPLIGSVYLFNAILVPFLALSLAAVGLNILTGFAGQLSLGSAAFMAVGAYAAYNCNLRLPGMPLLLSIALGGLCAACVGLVFGLPSLRLRGFYLAVSTLAAQFFVQWVLTNFGWFSNHNASGVISAPPLRAFGIDFSSPAGHYLFSLAVVALLTWFAVRLSRAQTGRNWIAIRDMDIAAAVIGVPIFRTKLLAFAISSFYCGVAGALWAFAYLGTVEPAGFDLDRSFQVLFIIILGGLASIRGAFLGTAFVVLFPIALSRFGDVVLHGAIDSGLQENIQKILFGTLIIAFLIAEPQGLANLLRTGQRKLRAWPFPA